MEVWPNQTRYEGHYREGKKWGTGKFIWPDGSFYEGEFHDDTLNGKGRGQ